MKLHYAVPSPFVRKVRIAALELGLDDAITKIEAMVAPGKTDAKFGLEVNPLRKIPALELDDGTVLVDSTLICEYLDALHGQHQLVPANGPERWQVLNGQAVANGIMEAAVSVRYETFLRPEAQRWATWSDEQWVKIDNGLAWFEKKPPGELQRIDSIALACALGYLDFRSPERPWRDACPKLAAWHQVVAEHPSYVSTSPNG